MDIASLLARARQHANAGEYRPAAACFERVLASNPDSEVALGGLGHCLGRLGQTRSAIETLLRAGTVLSRRGQRFANAAPLLDIAYELHLVKAFRESIKFIDSALRLNPTVARAHYLKAQALERTNELKAARQSAGRAFALAPKESNAAILLATLEVSLGNLLPARQLLEEIIANKGDPNRARALFELGRVLDRIGEFDAAFERFAQAGALALESPAIRRLDLSSVYRELAKEQQHCTKSWHDALSDKRAEDGVPDPVFMLGFYRSGTTLMEQVLGAHSKIITSDEENLIPQVLRELERVVPEADLHWTQRLETLDTQGITRLRRFYWERVTAFRGDLGHEVLFLDKTALNTINIGLIQALFPTATILFALRDPRDVCLSCFMQALVPNALTMHFLNWEEATRFYDAVLTHWEVMLHRLHPRTVVIRYEDLINDLRAATLPALQALEIAWEPNMARYYESARKKTISTPSFSDVTRPLYRSAQGRWRRYERHFDGVLGTLQPHIDRYGYHEDYRVAP